MSNAFRRLIYASRHSPAVVRAPEAPLADILAASSRNNAEVDLTGLLLTHEGRFLQVLEGAPETVETMYLRIRHDRRHQDLRLIADETARERRFEAWSMCARHFSAVDAQILEALRYKGDFEPERFGAGAVLRLLVSVSTIRRSALDNLEAA